jgi:hypothetical protein
LPRSLLHSHLVRPYQNAFAKVRKVIEYLLQITFTNFPQEGHLIAAISPYNSGIVALG